MRKARDNFHLLCVRAVDQPGYASIRIRRPARLPVSGSVQFLGGLVVSQLLTLYITPVFYIYMDSFQGLIKRVGRRRTAPAERVPVAPRGD